jgi:hypothetical protein
MKFGLLVVCLLQKSKEQKWDTAWMMSHC